MLAGAQLRRLREACGLTLEEAAGGIRASHSKLSRMENGRTGFKFRDVIDLLARYQADEADYANVLALLETASDAAWWLPYGDVVPGWFECYLGLEPAAHVIRSYEVQFVPGLLQTRDYARAVIELGHRESPEEEIDRRVAVRIQRQRLLTLSKPPHFWAVIDEAALRRPMGGVDVMRAQLQHLIELCTLPQVTIQVLRFKVGSHAAAGGPITLLRFPQEALPDIVYLEQLASAVYLDKPGPVSEYLQVMNRLVTVAAQPCQTPQILRQISSEL